MAFIFDIITNAFAKIGDAIIYKKATKKRKNIPCFFDNGISEDEFVAIVECVSPFKEEVIVTPPEDLGDVITDEYGNEFIRIDSYFTDPEAAKAAGIKLYECVKGTYYDQYMEFECPILMLEHDSLDDVEL